MNAPRRMPRIVMMEDNPADVLLVREALKENGLEVDLLVIPDGEAALDWVGGRSSQPGADLILLDLNLPRHHGIEVLQRIRLEPRLNGTPVAVFSSSDTDQDRSVARQLGADHFLLKPCSLDEFLEVGAGIKRILGPGETAPPRGN